MPTVKGLQSLAGRAPVRASLAGANWAYLVVKIGDQEVPEGAAGFLEGDIVDVINPNEQQPESPSSYPLSDDMQRIFYVRKIKLSEVERYRAYIQQETDADGKTTQIRKRSVDFNAIAAEQGLSKQMLLARLRSREVVRVHDCTGIEADITVDRKDRRAKIRDANAWTGGAVTVGSGGTYATHVALAADAGTFVADGSATVVSDITETAFALINNDMGAFNVDFNGAGFTIYVETTNTPSIFFNATQTGQIRWHGYTWERTVATTTGTQVIFAPGDIPAGSMDIFNCRFRGGGLLGSGLGLSAGNQIVKVYQCVLTEFTEVATFGIYIAPDTVLGSRIENCTFFNNYVGVDNVSFGTISLRNLASFNASSDCFRNTTFVDFVKCASSDATGSEASLQNLVAADVFQSTTSSDADFLLPVAGGALQDAAEPTLWAQDIEGVYFNGYIGARQVAADPLPDLPTVPGDSFDLAEYGFGLPSDNVKISSYGYHKQGDPASTGTTDREQQGDVFIFQTDNGGDIQARNGVITVNGALESAVYLSLFGGSATYWGNVIENQPERKLTSETEAALESVPSIPANLRLIEDAVRRDLAWMLTLGAAEAIEVSASLIAPKRIKLEVTIDGSTSLEFAENWEASL